ncbi:MAG: CAP domain-containing protein [bacterium]
MTKNIKDKISLLLIPSIENQYRPRLLSSRFLIYYIALLAVLKLVSASYIILLPKTNFFADISSQVLLTLTNKNRADAGLLPLKNNSKLSQAAYLKAQDMLNNDYFNHNSPRGVTPWFWIKKANYVYRYAGENLAIGFIDSEETFNAWVNSPSHYANIINSRYQETGIAVLKGDFQGNNTYVVVQMFGSPKPIVNSNFSSQKPQASPPTATTKPIPSPPPATSFVAPANNGSAIVSGDETEIIDSSFDLAIIDSMLATSSQRLIETKNTESTFLYKIIKILANQYSRVLEMIIFASLFLLTISLLLNIFIHINIQHRDLILRASLMLLVLITIILMSKPQLLSIIHQSSIAY